ncbi:MAG: hypothetical protein ACXW3I_10175 [Allosphingosinicella sp.]
MLTPDTKIAALCLVICLIFTAIADFLSIAQTRLFAKTIETFSDWRITATMVTADIMMSLTLFLLSFSVARTISYVLILLSAAPEAITSRTLYSPRTIQVMAHRVGVTDQILALKPEEYRSDPRLNHLRGILAADLTAPGSELALARLVRQDELHGVERQDLFGYAAQWQCLNPSPSTPGSFQEGVSVFGNTQTILVNGWTALANVRPKLRPLDSVDEVAKISFAEVAKEQASCPMPTIAIYKSFKPREVLSVIGPLNAYMSALAGSSYGVFLSLPSKFSGYEVADLNAEIGQFLANGATARSMPFFGMGRPNNSFAKISQYFSALELKVEGETAIPLTTFAASSILASLVLLISLIAGWSSRIALLVIQKTSVNVDQRKLSRLVFTFSACAVSLLLIGCAVGSWLLERIWNFLLA